MSAVKDLTRFGLTVLSDLQRNRPKAYRDLERAGSLHATVFRVQEQAKDEMVRLLDSGLDYNQAMELVFMELLRVPTEQEEPETPERFLPLVQNAPTSMSPSPPS